MSDISMISIVFSRVAIQSLFSVRDYRAATGFFDLETGPARPVNGDITMSASSRKEIA